MAKRFVVPFAATGDKTVTPDATDPAGAISYSQGWGSQYQLPDTDPSYRPVGRQEMNGVLNDITGAIAEVQTLGYPEWVAVTGLVTPYAINAHVRHSGFNWRNTVTNNSAEPGVGAGWVNTNIASDTNPAYMRFGTPAEQIAGILATVAANPAGVLALITAMFPKRVFVFKDFVRIPDVSGGVIFQWGPITNAASAAKSEVFATPFPLQRGAVLLTGLQATGNTQAYAVLNSSGLSGFQWSGFAAAGGAAPVLSPSVGAVQGFFFAVGN